MIVLKKSLKYKYGDVIKIKPIFDVHLGSKHCDINLFKKYLENNDDLNTYFIGGGDLIDGIVTSDLKRYQKSSDGTSGDDILDEQIDKACNLLEPYKDRILGLGLGNHETSIIKYSSTNPIKRICKRLNTDFLGYSGLIKLVLTENGSRGRTVIVRFHHGWGGGSRTQGADLTKFSKDVAYFDADLFLYGHVHRLQSDRIPRLGIVGTKLISKPKILCICGTFLKTYSDNSDATYSEIKGYPPVEVGSLVINIKPNGNWVDMWIDI